MFSNVQLKTAKGFFLYQFAFFPLTTALTLMLTKRYQLKALKVASIGISLEYHLLGIFQSCNEPKGFLLSGEAAADWFPMFFTQRKNSRPTLDLAKANMSIKDCLSFPSISSSWPSDKNELFWQY